MTRSSEARVIASGRTAIPKSGPGRVAWEALPATLLFRNLESGIDFHLGHIETVINADARERVVKYLQSNFGDLAVDVPNKYIKKLANSALALGSRGLERTLDAIQDLPFWSDDLQLIQREGHNPIPLIDASRLKLNGDICESCHKKIKDNDGTIVVESLHHYHLKCWCALDVREQLASLRSTLIAISKQAKSSRVILKANEKDFSSKSSRYEEFMIQSRDQYEDWRDQLFYRWLQKTDVKEEFRSTYRANFEEYADSILRYIIDDKLPSASINERLLKHLQEGEAQRITKRLSAMPVKALKYFGLIDEETKDQAPLVSYLEAETPLTSEDLELKWTEKALCATTDPAAFFDGTESGLKAAIRICNRCPVKAECLDYALKNGETSGIWGGKTPDERRELAEQISVGHEVVPVTKSKNEKNKTTSGDVRQNLYKFEFKKYGDLTVVGEKYREGYSVILNMSDAPDEDRKRAIDFLAGLVFVNSGKIERIGNGIFLLLAPGAVALGANAAEGLEPSSIESLRNQLLA